MHLLFVSRYMECSRNTNPSKSIPWLLISFLAASFLLPCQSKLKLRLHFLWKERVQLPPYCLKWKLTQLITVFLFSTEHHCQDERCEKATMTAQWVTVRHHLSRRNTPPHYLWDALYFRCNQGNRTLGDKSGNVALPSGIQFHFQKWKHFSLECSSFPFSISM